ncbi:MAG: RluA family pseudouridine synthase [Alphaproteobacteria bacterium]|nr:RluA family pseudouridine synthase [Alphaproteobacteria bacterium]
MDRHELACPSGAKRLDRFLAEALDLSRSRLAALVRDGHVTIDGVVATRPGASVPAASRVVVQVPPPPPSELRAEDLAVPVLFQDEHIVVVDKPAGMVVHPAKGHDAGTLVHGLLHLLADADGDAERPGIVHRLDKGTSGVMVVARTAQAHEALGAAFAARDLDRRYLALCWGEAPDVGRVEGAIARHPQDRKRMAIVETGGKWAATRFAGRGVTRLPVPGSRDGGVVSLVECKLETGRTHQVRVHLTHAGLPLLGDPVYKRRVVVPPLLAPLLADIDHQLLHAWSLAFRHPVDGRWLSFRTDPPADFAAVQAAVSLPTPAGPGRDLEDRATNGSPGGPRPD